MPATTPDSSPRIPLLMGFGGLLCVMAVSGLDALSLLDGFRKEDRKIREEFLSRNRLLNDVRAGVYLSGTYLRDYLLERDPGRAAGFGASFRDVRRTMERDLTAYASQLEPAGSKPYAALRTQLANYWLAIDPALGWNATVRHAAGYEFLRDEVFPRRAAMLDIAGEIGRLNEEQLRNGSARAELRFAGFQSRLAVTIVAALALGVGMAWLSARQILRLEAQALVRYREADEARRQLANLSARLVGAQEAERRSISRELHDEVGQSLSAVLVELRNLSTPDGVRSAGESREQIESIRSLVEGSIRVIRNMALLLRPSMLDDLGLIPALRWQAREVSKRTSMDVSVTADLASEDLSDEFKTCIYRVAQEALNNCARHSGAATVRISVARQGCLLTLSVRDDGAGFDARQNKGLGLLGIEERVAQLGGVCRVDSLPGSGATITAEFHLKETQSDDNADSNSFGGRPQRDAAGTPPVA